MSRFILVTLILAGIWPAIAAGVPSKAERSFQGAEALETPLKDDQNYYKVRKLLLGAGWKPVVIFKKDFEHKNDWGTDLDWIYAKPFWRHGFREIEFCSGMEANYCGFHYRRKDRCLYVLTAGEYGMRGSPTVNNWLTYPLPAKGGCSVAAVEKLMQSRLLNGSNVHHIP